jgi:hypothetical protein
MKKCNIIALNVKPESEDVRMFKKCLTELVSTMNDTDRAGRMIGRRNLTANFVTSFISTLIFLEKYDVREYVLSEQKASAAV